MQTRYVRLSLGDSPVSSQLLRILEFGPVTVAVVDGYMMGDCYTQIMKLYKCRHYKVLI